jgi:hypothetical protein
VPARIPGLLSTWLNSRVGSNEHRLRPVPLRISSAPVGTLWVLVMGRIPARTQHLLLADEIDTEHASTRRGPHARVINYASLIYPIFCAASRRRPE